MLIDGGSRSGDLEGLKKTLRAGEFIKISQRLFFRSSQTIFFEFNKPKKKKAAQNIGVQGPSGMCGSAFLSVF